MANYLNNKSLLQEIIKSKEQNKLTTEAGNMIILLCKKIVKKMRYDNEDDMHDCYSTAVEALLRNWYMFDETQYTNIFAYYSEIAKRGLAKGWNELHKKKGIEGYQKNISLNSGCDNDNMYNL